MCSGPDISVSNIVFSLQCALLVVDHGKLPTRVEVENLLPVKYRSPGPSGTLVKGNAGDIVPVCESLSLTAG